VLVAHADQTERDFMAAALRAWGYTVVTAQRGDEATDRYRQGGLLAVLVDRGVLGDAAAWRDVRKVAHARVPMILLAATADSDDLDAFAREQANAILTPPFQLKPLRAAIRAVVKEKECV
jgi:DNA-binding response OmpR family regulator